MLKTQNKITAKKFFAVVTLLFFSASILTCFLPEAKAQTTYFLTINDTEGLSSITVTDNTNSKEESFSSFPATFNFTGESSLTFNASASVGYVFFYYHADATYNGNPDVRNWYGNPYTSAWYGNISLTVNFRVAEKTLTIDTASPSGGGYYTWANYSTAQVGTYTFLVGENQTVRAYANNFYVFSYWMLDGQGVYNGYSIDGVSVAANAVTLTFEAWLVSEHTLQAVFAGPYYATSTPTPTATPTPSNNTYTITINPQPTIGCANITVSDVTSGNTTTFTSFPASFTFTNGDQLTFSAEPASDYQFEYFYFAFTNGGVPATTIWYVSPFTVNWYTASNINVTVNFQPLIYNYGFYGVFDETTGLQTTDGCTVYVYSTTSDVPNSQFTLNGTYLYNSSGFTVSHFMFDLGSHTREYWIANGETEANIYVFNDTLTDYVINFMDMSGLLDTSRFIEAKYYVNGSLFTVEKRMVDSQNSIAMSLVNGRIYQFYIQPNNYLYGDVLMTATTGVQLILRGVDFPKETLLEYRYVHAWAVRDFLNPIGAITVSFEDVNEQTTSVLIEISYNNTLAYNYTSTDQRFSVSWLEAVNSTDYLVTVTITHSVMGELEYKYFLRGQNSLTEAPFSLAFLGSIGIETAYFFPALLIVFVAACFSELTAEIASVLTVIIAVLLTVLGWIPIASSLLVSGMAFAILGGVVTVRRRII